MTSTTRTGREGPGKNAAETEMLGTVLPWTQSIAALVVILAMILSAAPLASPLQGLWPTIGVKPAGPFLIPLGLAIALSEARQPSWRRLGRIFYLVTLISAVSALVPHGASYFGLSASQALMSPRQLPVEYALAIGCLSAAGLGCPAFRTMRSFSALMALLFVPVVLALMSLSLLAVTADLLLAFYPAQFSTAIASSIALLLASVPLCHSAFARFKQASAHPCLLELRVAFYVLVGLPLILVVVGIVTNGVLVRMEINRHQANQEALVASHAKALEIELNQFVQQAVSLANEDASTPLVSSAITSTSTQTSPIPFAGVITSAQTVPQDVLQVESKDGHLQLFRVHGKWWMDVRMPPRAGRGTSLHLQIPSATLTHVFDGHGSVNLAEICELHGERQPCNGIDVTDRSTPSWSRFEGVSGEIFLATAAPMHELGLVLQERSSVTNMIAPAVRSLLTAGFLVLFLALACTWLMVRAVRPLVHRLDDAKTRLRTILETVPVAVVTVEGNGRLQAQNLAARMLLGDQSSKHSAATADKLKPIVDACSAFGDTRKPEIAMGSCHWVDDQGSEHELEIFQATHDSSNGEPNLRVLALHDVTRRNLAERTLQQSNEQLLTILASVGEGICSVNLDGQILALNEAAARLLALTPIPTHTGIGMDRGAVNIEQLGGLEVVLRSTFGSNEMRRGNMILLAMDGTELPITYVATPLVASGEPFGAVVLFRDETERLAADRVLQERETLYRTLADNTSDLITRHTANGVVLHVSPNARSLLGYDANELVGMPFEMFCRDSSWRALLPVFSCGAANGTCISREVELRSKDGRLLWFEMRCRVIVVSPGTGGHEVIAVTSGIDSRKRAEAAARFAHELLQKTQAVAEIGSWHLDLRNGRIWWSPETYRILGVPLDRTPLAALHDGLVHPDDRLRLQRVLERTLREKTPHEIAYRVIVDNEVRWIVGRGEFEFDSTGEATAWLGSIQDRTNAHQREQELSESRKRLRELAARQEREREAERARLAREVHDEIGQHITGLRMAIHLLEIHVDTESYNVQRPLGAFKERIDALSRVTRDVITSLRPLVLDEGFEPAVEWLIGEFRKNYAVTVSLEFSGKQIGLAQERSMVIFRILQEALTNVARHAKANKVSIQVNRMADHIELSVEDDGVGFNSDAVRGELTFGLIGMRERALMVGGRAVINSRSGEGTTVLATIPSTSCADTLADGGAGADGGAP